MREKQSSESQTPCLQPYTNSPLEMEQPDHLIGISTLNQGVAQVIKYGFKPQNLNTDFEYPKCQVWFKLKPQFIQTHMGF